ncbi:MAG: hypothetical protein IJW98_06705, partial [Clostridia bacterium]|nr:hypothetical protein [Clostridia bacterium]
MRKLSWKSSVALLLSASMLVPSAALLASCNKNQNQQTTTQGDNTMNPTPDKISADLKVETMKVNETDTPIGIDTTPVFSWIPSTEAYDQFQTAYRVIVSSTADKAEKGEGDLWDSGKVESAFCYSVPYKGADLSSHTTYFWKVQVWDADKAVGTSPVSKFTTGILSKAEWTGEWIGKKPDSYSINFSGAKWIWLSPSNVGNSAPAGLAAGSQYFRTKFSVDTSKTVKQALLAYTADDASKVSLNGVEWSESTAWSSGVICDLTGSLQADNTLAIVATNATNGYAGLIAKIVIEYTDGTKTTLVSDEKNWKVSSTAAAGWTTPEFDDSAWKAPTQYCNFGGGPWGSGVALSAAGDRAATLLRNNITLKGDVAEAYLSIAGLGFFELMINGKTPDDTVMNCCNT